VADPQVRVVHQPAGCGGCGDDLDGAVQSGVAVRQVFDLPDIAVRVTEHRIVSRRCRCGRVSTGQAPDGVDAPVQYGPRANAAAVYLQQALFGAHSRTAQAMTDLFGMAMSAGAVAAAHTGLFRQAALVAIKDLQHERSKAGRKLAALVRRMRDRIEDYLSFTVDLRSPFDNNRAEQQIRMVKIRQEVSGCLRTLDEAQQFTLIRSYLATATAHGHNALQALADLAAGHPGYPPANPAPDESHPSQGTVGRKVHSHVAI
jgi:transposase